MIHDPYNTTYQTTRLHIPEDIINIHRHCCEIHRPDEFCGVNVRHIKQNNKTNTNRVCDLCRVSKDVV